MTSKEIIKRNIDFDHPPRIGFDFNAPGPRDVAHVAPVRFLPPRGGEFDAWGKYPELLAEVPFFSGEVRLDAFGNIYGRLEGKTKGECVKGVLERDFGDVDAYRFPGFDAVYDAGLDAALAPRRDKYVIGGLPVSVFSTFRDMRRMENALPDTLENPEYIRVLLDKVCRVAEDIIAAAARHEMDAVMMADDWGTQIALLVNPASFRQLFLSAYERVAGAAHRAGMHFLLHSCGCIAEIIPDLIAAGIDGLQLDQPEVTGVTRFAREFGGKVALYSPVDIQKILQTGDRALIEHEARHMIRELKPFGGGFIAKDYPSLADINVKDEWAAWARDVFVAEGTYGA